MICKEKLKLKTKEKKLKNSDFIINTSQNLFLKSLENMKKVKNLKRRNKTLLKENISKELLNKLNRTLMTKISNKHSRNKTLLNQIKIGLRNQKLIDSNFYYTDFNDNKNSTETTTTAITSKRNFQNSNSPNSKFSKKKIKLSQESFNKIKDKI